MTCSAAIAAETDGSEKDGGSVIMGIILCEMAAATLAFSMNVQRYALTTPVDEHNRISIKGCNLSRNQLWLCGLLLYAIANGFYIVSMAFAPLSLLSALFATSLVFNAFFATCMLGEKISRQDMIGDAVILGSVIVCAVFAPSENVEYSAFDIEKLSSMGTGIAYIVVLVFALTSLASVVMWFERLYPTFGIAAEQEEQEVDTDKHNHKVGGGISDAVGRDARKKSRLGNRMSIFGSTSVGVAAPKKKPSHLRRMSQNLAVMLGISKTKLPIEAAFEDRTTTTSGGAKTTTQPPKSRLSATVMSDAARAAPLKIDTIETRLDARQAVTASPGRAPPPPPSPPAQPPAPPLTVLVYLGERGRPNTPAPGTSATEVPLPPDLRADSWLDFRRRAAAAVGLPSYSDSDGSERGSGGSGAGAGAGGKSAKSAKGAKSARAPSSDFELYTDDATVVYGLSQIQQDGIRLFVAPLEGKPIDDGEGQGRGRGLEPGRCLVALMTVVYPTVLGLFETMVQVCMKAGSSMAYIALDGASNSTAANGSGVGNQAESPALYVVLVLLAFGTTMVILWLRKVYSRFETSVCLPVEYGVVTSFSVCSGLVFFREYQCIPTSNIIIMGCCMVGVILGISILSAGKISDAGDESKEQDSSKEPGEAHDSTQLESGERSLSNSAQMTTRTGNMQTPNPHRAPLSVESPHSMLALPRLKRKHRRTVLR